MPTRGKPSWDIVCRQSKRPIRTVGAPVSRTRDFTMKRQLGGIFGRIACVVMAIVIAALPPIAASAADDRHVARGHCLDDQADGRVSSESMSELVTSAGSTSSGLEAGLCLAAVAADCCPSCGEVQGAFGIAPLAVVLSFRDAAAILDAETAEGIAMSPGLEPPIG